jgi:hypothetical protein
MNPTTLAGSTHDLANARATGKVSNMGQEVLLQGATLLGRPTFEGVADGVGNVPDLDVLHACISHAGHAKCNPTAVMNRQSFGFLASVLWSRPEPEPDGQSPASKGAGGKSGLHRAGWPITTARREAGKVPQRTDRRSFGSGKGETVR